MGIWHYPPFRTDLDATGYHVYSAHSGYMEVAIGLGWLGVAALSIMIGIFVLTVLGAAARRADLESLWLVALLAYCLAVNLGETYIGANLLPWALLVAVVTAAIAARASDGPNTTPSPAAL